MSDSTSHLDELSASQSSKEVTANALFNAMSPNALFGRRATTTAGLVWGYYGGKYRKADGTVLTISNTTLTLTASATNYIKETDGVVSVTTSAPSGWPGPLASSAKALYEVVCSSATATSYTDYRTPSTGPAGATGATGATGPTGPSGAAPLTTKGDLLTYDTASVRIAVGSDGQSLVADSAQAKGVKWASQPLAVSLFYPGAPTASVLIGSFAAPSGITTLTFAAAIAGSSGKALVAATAQTDLDVRKNATTSAGGSSVGTIRFAASGTVPTFIAASGFTLTGGTDYLTVWGPASPDSTLANIAVSLYCTRS